MNRLIAMACALLTMLGVWAFTPEPELSAAPPAGMATDCAPNSIWGTYTPSGFHTGQSYGPFNGWSYSYGVGGHWTYTCPPSDVSYAYTCAPCYSIKLFRNTAYPNGSAWVDMQKPESYFQVQNAPIGNCGTGGSFNTSFMMTGLTAGQYEIQITFGAGDDRRCYTIGTFGHTFIVP